MMTLAWVLFAFVGLFTARYMREVWEPRQLLGEKAWFTVSRVKGTKFLINPQQEAVEKLSSPRERRKWSLGLG